MRRDVCKVMVSLLLRVCVLIEDADAVERSSHGRHSAQRSRRRHTPHLSQRASFTRINISVSARPEPTCAQWSSSMNSLWTLLLDSDYLTGT